MAVRDEFVHLHVHTEYSLLDGMCRIPQLLAQAREYGMPAIAITDHGNLFGAVEFYRQAMKAGVKPIIGSEMYVARGSRLDRNVRSAAEAAYHLVLLAENETGYKNLLKLSSASFLEGFYYKPRVDKELLDEHHEGLIALSACLGGEVAAEALRGNLDAAEQAICTYRDIFGKDSFFVELQDEGMPEQHRVNPVLVKLARECGVGIVATNDCHYVKQSDSLVHDILLCIQTGTTVEEEGRLKFPTNEFYLKSPEEMAQRFSEWPQALDNAAEIGHRCNVELEFGQRLLPRYPVPEEYTSSGYLRELVDNGLKQRYAEISSEVTDRVDHELDIINQMNYTGYFLVVWDFVNFARRNGIPVGPGRGSGTGSLVSYALRITDLDPLKYGLQFERFVNPERVSPPDFDIDFCYTRREKVISYVREKYGDRNVSQIITFGTMAARGAIRDVGRALNLPYGLVDKVAKLVPWQPGMTLTDALEKEQELRRMKDQQPEIDRLWQIATALEGLVRHASVHAAGVVISAQPLTEYVPLYRAKGDPREPITTQYESGTLEKIGLMKIDFLGLRTLTVIDDTIRSVKENRDVELDLSDIALDDQQTFELLRGAWCAGVFQLESAGMRDLARKIGIERFEEIVALVALFRPGPMHMLDDYVQRKHGLTPIKYDHALLKPILEETYGVMLYQEQVIKIASEVGGFPLGKADLLRRAMGKKDPDEMAKLRDDFVKGARKRKVSKGTAEKIFNHMAQFAGYGFNKSHSAAYALIAYWTAYLKANYPLEFMAATLSSEMGNSDKLAGYIEECKRMGIAVRPPDINESRKNFTVVGDAIRFGLAAIKNVGEGTVEAVVEERESGGAYGSIFDLCQRVDMRQLNKRALESLVKAGALDSTGATRSQAFAVVDTAAEQGNLLQREKESGQTSLFDLLGDDSSATTDQRLPDIDEWPENKLLAHEKEVLGFYVTGHPLAQFAHIITQLATAKTGDVSSMRDGASVTVGGIIAKVKAQTTRRGDRMAFVTLEDLDGFVEVIVYAETYQKSKGVLMEDVPVIVLGRIGSNNGEMRIVANEIFHLDEAQKRLVRAVHVRLMAAGLEEPRLEQLAAALSAHSGQCDLYFHLVTPRHGEVTIKAGARSRVEPSNALVEAAQEILGEESIWFTAANQRGKA